MKKKQSLISGLLVCALCAALLITGTMGSFEPAMADANAAMADSTAAAVTGTAITAVGAAATGASVTATGAAVAADGVAYEYREMEQYKNADGKTKQCENAVEIVGATLPDGMTELVIPETLDGKDVISLDLNFGKNVQPSQDETDTQVRKLVLSKNIRLILKETIYLIYYNTSSSHLLGLKEVTVDPENPDLTAEDGILYDKKMKRLLLYPRMKPDLTYKMPDSVEEATGIDNSFLRSLTYSANPKLETAGNCRCANLESVYMPDNIRRIEPYGFTSCPKLSKIRFSKNLKKIWYAAFQNCLSLTEVKLPEGIPKIGNRAFRWCYNLKKVQLPDSVNIVGWKAFSEVPAKNIKRSKYLISPRNKKIAKYYDERSRRSSHRFERAVTLKRKGKTYYFPYWKIWGIEPSKKRETLKAGKTKKLSVVGYIQEGSGYKKGTMPAKFLTFSSSDSRVASVTSKGKIKGKKKGKAVIKVRYPKGEYVDGRCKIRVRVS